MVRVALLDDHPAVRAGLDAILAPQPDLDLVGSATNENELWTLLARTRPEVLILDLHHPGRDGLQICLRIKLAADPPGLVLYSATTSAGLAAAAAVAGANALVGKSSAASTLTDAIRRVARDSTAVPLLVPSATRAAAAVLPPQDHAILAMRIAGESPSEIATTLGIPEPALAGRTEAIVQKLARQIGNPADLALASGWA